MDIEKYLQPEFDFSRLGLIELELMEDISFEEIINAYKNRRTRVYTGYPLKDNRWFCVGFGNRSRCLEMFVHFNEHHKISFIDINLANEYGIESYWCVRGVL